MSGDLTFQRPWVRVGQHADILDQELEKEVCPEHPLYGSRARAVAQRTDSDDVLFQLENSRYKYAVAHLTWSGQTEPNASWPATQCFDSLEEWIISCMKPDHREYLL